VPHQTIWRWYTGRTETSARRGEQLCCSFVASLSNRLKKNLPKQNVLRRCYRQCSKVTSVESVNKLSTCCQCVSLSRLEPTPPSGEI